MEHSRSNTRRGAHEIYQAGGQQGFPSSCSTCSISFGWCDASGACDSMEEAKAIQNSKNSKLNYLPSFLNIKVEYFMSNLMVLFQILGHTILISLDPFSILIENSLLICNCKLCFCCGESSWKIINYLFDFESTCCITFKMFTVN